jgi:hypothetical protein
MSEPEMTKLDTVSKGQAVSFVAAFLLIGSFCYRMLTAAHEYPMRSEQVMTIAFDFALLAYLIARKDRLARPLFWVALVAGLGLFAIRLNGNASWWTGHLVYTIPPR